MQTSKGRQSGRAVAVFASLIVFGLAAPTVQAVPVFFDFSGTCGALPAANCGLLGLSAGDAVSGFFEVDDSALLNNTVDLGEVTQFEFVLGNVTLDNDLFDFVLNSNLVLNAAMDGFVSGSFSIWDTLAASIFTEFELLNLWTYTQVVSGDAAFGSGQFSRRAVAAPEPAIVFLLGIGLIGLAGISRRSLK